MMKAIIADDEPLLLNMQKTLLPRIGYEVVGETNQGGNLVALALQHQPDLLLTDNDMPNKQGLEAVQELRNRGYVRPIIINSGRAIQITQNQTGWEEKQVGQWYNHSLDTHLIQKPYRLADLITIIKRATQPVA